jgi:hypothetical protein
MSISMSTVGISTLSTEKSFDKEMASKTIKSNHIYRVASKSALSAAYFANVNNNGNTNYNNASNSYGVRPDSLPTNREGDVILSIKDK